MIKPKQFSNWKFPIDVMEYEYEMKMYESDEQKKGVSSNNVKIS